VNSRGKTSEKTTIDPVCVHLCRQEIAKSMAKNVLRRGNMPFERENVRQRGRIGIMGSHEQLPILVRFVE